jgi:hypothetical protein
MSVRTYLVLAAVACLVIGGCAVPSMTTNVPPGESPAELATVPPEQGATLPAEETPSLETPAATAGEPTPTNTLVVPPASPPPGGTATQEPGAPPPEEPTPLGPVPTALVDPELVALWEYATALRAEVAEPLEEMVTALDDLGIGSGAGDIVAICTGVDVVVSTLAEVQQGLDEVGAPPTHDADLQLAYDELNLALDDLEEGFALLQSACQTMNLRALGEAAPYLESGATHLENASEAIDRWEEKVGL